MTSFSLLLLCYWPVHCFAWLFSLCCSCARSLFLLFWLILFLIETVEPEPFFANCCTRALLLCNLLCQITFLENRYIVSLFSKMLYYIKYFENSANWFFASCYDGSLFYANKLLYQNLKVGPYWDETVPYRDSIPAFT